MDYSPPGSSIHGIFQARVLEWVAISFSKGSSWPRDWTWVSPIAGRCFTIWATREAHDNFCMITPSSLWTSPYSLQEENKLVLIKSFNVSLEIIQCFPAGLEGSVCLQWRKPRFNPWDGKIPWRRKWKPTPVHLPGKSHGWRSLVGYSPWGHKELDMTEQIHFTRNYSHQSFSPYS